MASTMTRCSRSAERLIARLSCAVLIAVVTLGAGCPPPAFHEHGPREVPPGGGGPTRAELLAWERPRIEVSPVEVLAGHASEFTVLEHVADGGGWALHLEPEAGEPVVVRYQVAGGVRLPCEVGERLWFNQSSNGVGLVIRDGDGIVRAAVSIDSEGSDAVGRILSPSFDVDRLVYSEAIALPSGCLALVDHHELEVRQAGQRSYVVPGSVTRIELPSPRGAIPMDLYALDVSRPAPRQELDDARCPALGHVSWLVVRAGEPEPRGQP